MKCDLCKSKKARGIGPTRGEFPEPVNVCNSCSLSLPNIDEDGFPISHFKSENGFWYFVFIHSKHLYPYFYPSSRPDFRHLNKDKFANLLKLRDFDKKLCKRLVPDQYSNEKEDLLYFAYGSEINQNILKKLKVKFKPVEKGKIYGCKIEFCEKRATGKIKATVTMGTDDDYMEGMIYLLKDEGELIKLEDFFSLSGSNFMLRKILVHLESGQPALAMIHIHPWENIVASPDKRYLNHMIKGAKQNNLSKDWINKLKTLKGEKL